MDQVINAPSPFKGLNIRIPIKGEGVLIRGLQYTVCSVSKINLAEVGEDSATDAQEGKFAKPQQSQFAGV